MRRNLLDLVILLVVATVATAIAIVVEPGARAAAFHAYVIVAGVLGMMALVSAAGESLPRRRRSQFEAALDRTDDGAAARPVQLARLEREVTLAVATAYDLHVRLLPQLREIARCRLERAGRRPSPETLGRFWDLLRPDRVEPDDRFGPGIAAAELKALVADLERIQ